MSEWIDATLGEVARIEIGGTPSRSQPKFWVTHPDTGHPWLSIADLTSKYVGSSYEQITDAGVRSSNVKPVPVGTPLMSFKLTIGRCAIAGVDLYTNEAIAAFHVEPTKVDAEWLYYELPRAASRGNTDSAIKGATLNKAKLVELGLRLPPLREQRQIAAILNTVDAAIRKTEQIIFKLHQVKQGLIRDLLTQGIDDNGELRDPQRHPELFNDSTLGRLPRTWSVEPIGRLLAAVDPAMRSGPFGSALLKSELVQAGVPLLGIDNVHVERFEKTYSRFVSPRKARELSRYFVRPDDVMITIMGTVGRCCVVPDDIGIALSSKHVWTLTFDPVKYSPYLACAQVNYAPWVLRHFARDEQGGVMSAIRSETLKTTPLPVPPRAEMDHIAAVLRAQDLRIVAESSEAAKLKLTKLGLMDDLLTGRVPVTDLVAQVT